MLVVMVVTLYYVWTVDMLSKLKPSCSATVNVPHMMCLIPACLAGFLLGPQIGGHFDPLQCGFISAGGIALCIVWVILFLPETLPPSAKLAVRSL